jgi:hypothetical protein
MQRNYTETVEQWFEIATTALPDYFTWERQLVFNLQLLLVQMADGNVYLHCQFNDYVPVAYTIA